MTNLRCVFTVLSCIIVMFNCTYGQSLLDPILKLPESELLVLEEKTTVADSLSRIKYTLAKKNLKKDIQKALLLFDEALELATEIDDLDFSIQIKKSKSLAYINIQQMDKAIELLDQAAIYYKKNNEKSKYASCLGFYAYIYTDINEYSKALKYSFEALDVINEINDDYEIQGINNRIGIIYGKMGKLEKAIEYHQKNIDIAEETGNKRFYRASLNNLGELYLELGNVEKAEKYLKETFELRKKEKNTKSLAFAFRNLADLETIKGDVHQAIHYLDSASYYFEKMGFLNSAAAALTKKALMHRELDDYGTYRNAIVETHDQVQEWNITNSEQLLSAYAEIKFDEGRSKEAYTNLKKSIQLYKDRYSETKSAEIEKLEQQLKKEQEEIKVQELSKEIEVRNIQRGYLFLILALGGALILLLLVTNRDRRKKNEAISKNLEDREVLIKEIHHRVKNNLQIVSSILSLQSRNITDVATKEAIVDSRDRVKSMALIHQKLYQEDNLKGVDIKDYLENLVSSLSHSYNLSETDVKIDFDVDPLILDIDSTIPIGLITNELITNALKYAFTKDQQGKIKVSLKEINAQLVLQVKDNGSSITDPTGIKEGFGFQLIRSLGRKLKAAPEIIIEDGLTIKLAIKNYKKISA